MGKLYLRSETNKILMLCLCLKNGPEQFLMTISTGVAYDLTTTRKQMFLAMGVAVTS